MLVKEFAKIIDTQDEGLLTLDTVSDSIFYCQEVQNLSDKVLVVINSIPDEDDEDTINVLEFLKDIDGNREIVAGWFNVHGSLSSTEIIEVNNRLQIVPMR